MTNLEMIKMMASQLKFLDVDVKEVEVSYLHHAHSQQKQCFNNAYLALNDNNDLYVLGYYMMDLSTQQIPIEHAWIKRGNVYYDVTLEPRDNDAYVSLVELTLDQVVEFADDKGHAPDLYAMNRFIGSKK